MPVERLERVVPVRISIAAATALIVLAAQLLPHPPSDAVLLALISLAGVVVGGDAWRPSGTVRGGPAPVELDPADEPTEERALP